MNENSPEKKGTDMEVVDDLIKRLDKSNPYLRDTFLPRAKELLEMGSIKDEVAKAKLEEALKNK